MRRDSLSRALFRLRMKWQRAQRGWSQADAYSLCDHLAHVIIGGIGQMREVKRSYPSELTMDEWDAILEKIQTGFQAWLDEDGWFIHNDEAKARYDEGMALFAKWFGGLWD